MTRPGRKPDLRSAFDLLAPAIADAARTASQALAAAGIRHVLAGGLAASAYGEPRATRDVVFLVGDEAFVHHGAIVTLNPAVPLAVGKVPIDVIPVPEEAAHLADALDAPSLCEGIPLIPLEHLLVLKLLSGRSRDKADVVAILRAGANAISIRRFVSEREPELGAAFDALVAEAEQDS